MKTLKLHFPKFLKQRKLLLLLPLLVLPCLYAVFHCLGGGRGPKKQEAATHIIMGFNTELPEPIFDKKEEKMTKFEFYQKADEDSLRKRASVQQDPYYKSSGQLSLPGEKSTGPANHASAVTPPWPSEDPRAEELLKKLDQFKQTMQKTPSYPAPPVPGRSDNTTAGPVSARAGKVVAEEGNSGGIQPVVRTMRPAEATAIDPQLDRLNKMLDKVIQIQQGRGAGEEPIKSVNEKVLEETDEETIPAVVEENQTLVSGATIVLRLVESVMIAGVRIPRNQLVYGLVSISNDRMLVDIHSIRNERSIYTTALQVYDLDGLPGIHIPGMLSREVAKQSADQGVGSVNLSSFDPGIGAQAANAGIQAAKSLFSRKIKLVRASVPAGYRVLLRNSRGAGQHAVRVWEEALSAGRTDSVRGGAKDSMRITAHDTIQDAARDSVRETMHEDFVPFLHRSVREGKVSLTLRGVYLREGLLWLSLLLKNDSRIDYAPDYIRPFIRDRRKMKRMAVQEIPVPVVYEELPARVAADSGQVINLAVAPFALGKDKRLVLQLAEKEGGREFNLDIKSKIIVKAK